MDIEKREIYRAIAEMAYVIAKSEKGLSSTERKAFYKIIEKELDYESWAAHSRFDLLDAVTQPAIDKAYREALFEFKKHKNRLTPDLKQKAITVVHQVATSCCGLSAQESLILDRFKNDLERL